MIVSEPDPLNKNRLVQNIRNEPALYSRSSLELDRELAGEDATVETVAVVVATV